MSFIEETIFIDVLLLLATIIIIYLTYNASQRLTQKGAKREWIVAFRMLTIAEIIILVYTVVDIPWLVGQLYFVELERIAVLKYILIYIIVTMMVVIPAINLLLRTSLTQREVARRQLMQEREDVLKQIQLATSKYLRKELGEAVFIKLSTQLHARVISIEAKLERMRIAADSIHSVFNH